MTTSTAESDAPPPSLGRHRWRIATTPGAWSGWWWSTLPWGETISSYGYLQAGGGSNLSAAASRHPSHGSAKAIYKILMAVLPGSFKDKVRADEQTWPDSARILDGCFTSW